MERTCRQEGAGRAGRGRAEQSSAGWSGESSEVWEGTGVGGVAWVSTRQVQRRQWPGGRCCPIGIQIRVLEELLLHSLLPLLHLRTPSSLLLLPLLLLVVHPPAPSPHRPPRGTCSHKTCNKGRQLCMMMRPLCIKVQSGVLSCGWHPVLPDPLLPRRGEARAALAAAPPGAAGAGGRRRSPLPHAGFK